MFDDLPEFALSVRQPWAWAILHAGKNFENRVKRAITMGAMKRGRICIHASKGMTRDEYEDGKRFIERARSELSCGFAITNMPRPDALLRGGIIGTVDVIDIVHEAASPWFVGPWALVLKNPDPLDEPIPVGGDLGYFNWRKNTGQAWSSKSMEAPLPWMLAWPDAVRPAKRAPAPTLAVADEPTLFPAAPAQQDFKGEE